MEIIESVFDLANRFMEDPEYVLINEDGIKETVSKMLKDGPMPFTEKKTYTDFEKHYIILEQLTGGAINYCYWYGTSNIRPLDCSSSKMFKVVEDSAKQYLIQDFHSFFSKIKRELAKQRFPLLEERIKHINEIQDNHYHFVTPLIKKEKSFNELFTMMIELFPGYASDMFLKRASLFFMMLYRIFGWYEEELHQIHIPADYQVPKMLNYFGCLDYSPELKEAITSNQLFPKGSQAECEIRSASIIACQKLCQKTGWNAAEVDGWFWLKRKECNFPFHLTVTTDY